MNKLKKINWVLFLVIGCFIAPGCQTTTTRNYTQATISTPGERTEIKEIRMDEAGQMKTYPEYNPLKISAYHKIKKGQSLWSISQYYNVSIEDLKEANKMVDAKKLKVGQVLAVPLFKRKNKASQAEFEWPLYGAVVAHYKENLDGKPNNGINIRPQDSNLVYASKKGVVEFSQPLRGHGYTVILKHSQGINTVYSNLSSSFVKEHDSVNAKQPIGEVGQQARTQETFLHFEIRKDDAPLNPLAYLP